MKQIMIRFVNGKIVFDFDGFRGDACFKEREKLLERLRKYGLNLEVEYEEKKPEAYEKEVVSNAV